MANLPKLYGKNAKKHPDKQLKLIAGSLREFGWQQPIVVDKNDEIIGSIINVAVRNLWQMKII